jgi:hypothetical protein
MISDLINVIRFITGFILIVISIRAYLKTKYSAMLFLTLGFGLITVGDIFSAVYFANNANLDNLLSDVFDILGLIALIIAVIKS